MNIRELLQWQWEGYAKYHQSRTNLLINIVAVPLFLIGTIALVASPSQLSLMLLAIAVGGIVVRSRRARQLAQQCPHPALVGVAADRKPCSRVTNFLSETGEQYE